MKKIKLFLTGLTLLLICMNLQVSYATNGPGIYTGSALPENGDNAVNELRQSGFKWVCVWTIHIHADGDLNFNGHFLMVDDGAYVGDATYPDFANNMAALKTAPTSIEWVEVGLSAWQSTTFDAVRDLVNAEGTGPGSTLYENFKALRDAVPAIDAFSFDDEKTYHEPSSTQFAIMLADLGFKVSVCPYTQVSHWQNVVANTNAARPGTIEDVHLQCYAGGAGNNPCTWDGYFAPEINVMPGVEPDNIASKMANWNNQCGITGGWIWAYDAYYGQSSTVQNFATEIANNITSVSTDPPGQASNPNPANGATGVSTSATLSWSAGSSALSQDVYFGTSNPPAFQGSQAETTYNPGSLSVNSTYYWRIDEANSYGTTTGNVWSFTTEANATTNLAPDASISVSSEYPNSNWSKEKLTDGIIGQDANGEWASDGEVTPWAQLNWSQGVTTSKVILYDRPSTAETIHSGTLTFSDGSSVSVSALPDNGEGLEVSFSERIITWVKFQVDDGNAYNNGLSEFEVIGYYGGTTPTPPVAGFSANTTSVTEGGSVNFTDNSTNTPTSWSWTFEGGTPSSSTAQNPAVTYNTPGTYNVTLTATNADGNDTETKTDYITVNAQSSGTVSNLAPDASISVSSEYPNATWSKEKLTDGISGQFGNGEWASDGEQTPWAQLNWTQSVVTSKIVLYDRSITNENINSGTLTFSDGSSVSVDALPTDGTAKTVTFSERTITWVKFQVDQGEGPNNGMSEFEVFGVYTTSTSSNLAPDASITVSSEYPNATWSKEKLTDGISGQFGNGEWASDGEQTPWAQLNWSQSVVTSKVVLYDRSLTNENISSGTLTFSDGSSVAVGALPVDGTALDVDFSERTITWVKFQVDQGEGPNNGMSEFEVIGYYDNLKSAADKEEVNTLTAIKVYPNPVKDVFTVEFPGESITRLAIFDIQGRLVYQNEFKDRIQISTDEISGSGILFIKLANESNTYIERIVIE